MTKLVNDMWILLFSLVYFLENENACLSSQLFHFFFGGLIKWGEVRYCV